MESERKRFVRLRWRGQRSLVSRPAAVAPSNSGLGDLEIGRRTVLASFVAAGVSAPFYRTLAETSVASSPAHAAQTRYGHVRSSVTPLIPPSNLAPFISPRISGEGVWNPAGRMVRGHEALYTTTIRPPENPSVMAGVAWMDTNLLNARLYSGSLSPGGLNWKYTAPVSQSAAKTLVAAFNGGFLLPDSHGGYLSEGHLVAPLRRGGASLVIYADGSATVGMWGRDVSMTSSVVAVRQNLTLLVDHGSPVPGLDRYDVKTWGVSLGAVVDTPRSGLGVTANGALVYVEGKMNIVDLARILVGAGAIRAMVLDMNPDWPIFASYRPATPGGVASLANGKDLNSSMLPTPARFFEAAYARDFITMSAV